MKPRLIGGWTASEVYHCQHGTWNPSTKFGCACGGLVEVSKSTLRKTGLIEVRLKVRHSYIGFLPA